MLVYVLIELLLYSTLSKCQISTGSNQVYVGQGILEGDIKYVAGKAVYSFLGIPYAQPPINDLRFKSPVSHPGWQVS